MDDCAITRLFADIFLFEINKTIFCRWIPENPNADDPDGYNGAAAHKGNCTEKFPSCSQSVWNSFL